MAKKIGRPKADINGSMVRKLAESGVKVKDIATVFGVTDDTIINRFSDELAKGRADLKINLRQWQLNAARQGNSALLIWLGKQYLEQTDSAIDEHILSAVKAAGLTKEDLIDLIRNKDKIALDTKKKSFEEFCEVAGYPKPYPKQIEMMEFGTRETLPRLILGARGYGKTDYVVILGIAYDIYCNPHESTNLIITKSKERNASMVNEISEALTKNGVRLEKSNSSCVRVAGLLGKDHSVSAVTIKTVSLRGRHPKRVIMDDPVTEDDTSDATRTVVEKKYNEVQKLTSDVLIIGQPAHKYDLYAKLRGLIKKMEVPHGSIPELDHDIEAQRLAGVDEASIQASYFLKILAEGATPFDNVHYIDELPKGGSVAFIDPSHEGGDYTAISVVKGYMQGVAVEGYVFKKAWNHCLDDIAPILKRLDVKRLCFETNALGDMPIDILRNTFKGIGIVGRRTTTNKHSRIMAAGTYAHHIHMSKKSHKTYIDHVVQYEYKAKVDDAPDSLASCLEWIGLIKGKG